MKSGKPYYFFGDYLWEKYGRRVLKLPINAGFSCPNRDGTISTAGCIFCSEDGSTAPTAVGFNTIQEQMENARRSFKRSDTDTRYIAYFQAFTNTYAPAQRLATLYETAIKEPDVIGLMVATRPDCLPDEVFDILNRYQRDGFELWLEIGMQTMHEKSLQLLNRGHTHDITRDAIWRASERKIPVCTHLILGITHETWYDMMETAREISSLPVSGVKIHHLHVIQGTALEQSYLKGDLTLMEQGEYVSTVCDFIERLRPDIIIHRLFGDRDEQTLVAPRWSLHKGTVIKAIGDEFSRRGTFQGFLSRDTDIP